MTTFVGDIDSESTGRRPSPRRPVAVRIPSNLLVAACARLVATHSPEPQAAAHRFIGAAEEHGIDLSLMWGVLDSAQTEVRQACLAVLGAGRTAMMFVSADSRRIGPPAEQATLERIATIDAACTALLTPIPGKSTKGVRLAQALLETRETGALIALRRSGFRQLGDLAYMRRQPGPLTREVLGRAASPELPAPFRMASVADLTMSGRTSTAIDAMLLEALEASYIDTKDCPELCGLRDASDVLESHKAVGRYDPAFWWLLLDSDRPVGCSLFSVSPEHDSLELVYLGLAPAARGKRIGAALLLASLRQLGDRILMTGGVTCAVDTRNTAALRLYQRASFRRFGVRIPMVRPLATT